MTRDEIIKLAREAGFCWPDIQTTTIEQRLERFAALVAAVEREACTQACDDAVLEFGEETDWSRGYAQGVRDVADGIRARSQHDPN